MKIDLNKWPPSALMLLHEALAEAEEETGDEMFGEQAKQVQEQYNNLMGGNDER